MSEQVEPHILRRYNLLKKVGSGAYGHVWKATDRKTGQLLALKKIFDAFQHSTDAQRTYREIVFLHELDHPNIIKLYEVIRAQNDKDLYLVFQYMEADLHNAISQKILKDIHNRYIIYQLIKGIKFLHSAELLHRDLKPSNVLLNSDCLLKICDFGLARSLECHQGDDMVLTEQVATRWYRSPEVLLGSQTYEKSADVWSIGCILAQMLIGKPIFPGNSTLNQLQRILAFTGKPKRENIRALNSEVGESMIDSISEVKQKNSNQWFKPETPTDAVNLVSKMLEFNPKKRITINEILAHSYLAKFHNPKEQYQSKVIINPPVSDNKKLGLRQYRMLIYDRIKQIYQKSNKPERNSISKQLNTDNTTIKTTPKRQSLKSNHSSILNKQISQPNDQHRASKNKQEIHQNPYLNKQLESTPKQTNYVKQRPSSNSNAFRQNAFCASASNQNLNYSNQKYSYHSGQTPTNIIQNHIPRVKGKQLQTSENDKLKKKNSLKEMIRNKKGSPSFKDQHSNNSIGINNAGLTQNPNYPTRNYSGIMTSANLANFNKYYKINPTNFRQSGNYTHTPINNIHKASINRF